ncbi:MAG TPA: glutamate-cysteine ligase family protein, partial [Polyangiaceae bacterium]|nr:glutamate-cysteine ligase family protein [Polyangiaceae bacterium]
GEPLPYAGAGVASVEELFARLQAKFGYEPYREYEGGPLLGLSKESTLSGVVGRRSITLEPGAQFELSGAPWPTLHDVSKELDQHWAELKPISDELGIEWLGIGFHPTAKPSELPWVPKERYPVMKEYLPKGGSRAHDMMQRTATVQANFDFSSEEDALRKVRVSLRLSPVIQTMTANSPFIEGRVSERQSERADVWLNMPKDRSGLIPSLWEDRRLGYRDYMNWALDAGMFLFKRGERTFKNTGQTFRSFMRDGFQGEVAQQADWVLHLNTLFPEARLKNTIEVRSCDMQNAELLCAVPALYTGLLYDDQALAQAERLAMTFSLQQVEQARPTLTRLGLAGQIAGASLRGLAEQLFDIAQGGLRRRGLVQGGQDESQYLAPLRQLLDRGQNPAEALTQGLQIGAPVSTAEVLWRAPLFVAK